MKYLGLDLKWKINDVEKDFIKYLLDDDFEIIDYKEYINGNKIIVKKNNLSMEYCIDSNPNNLSRMKRQFKMLWKNNEK